MTGKELIIYILENNLENETIFSDCFINKLMTVDEAAVKFEVGNATNVTWYNLCMIPGITINGRIYILPNAVKPVV